MARKIIQILALGSENTQIGALCNDGTLWFTHPSGSWAQVQEIPQPAAPDLVPEEVVKAAETDWWLLK